ncbi:MAG TPA: S9 family peptidase [Candidatus Elarobacter sp.]|nr:S9 family peptidase [Candidatus Elarobacter sp.]
MRHHLPPALIAILALIVSTAIPANAAPPPQQQQQRVLQEQDLRALVTLLDPQIAPDGKHVALVVRRPDFAKNKYRNELVLIDARTGAARTLVRERDDVSNARWSPAGDRVAFVATPPKDPDDKDEPSPQLYVLRLDGGEPARITDAKKGVESFAWRPDGRAFAYVARDESPDAKRIKEHDDWFEVSDNAWTSRANRAPAHLWTIDADGKHAHRVTHGTWSLDGEPAFAPDARRVYITRTPSASTNHYRARTIVAIDLATGTPHTIANASSSDSPIVSPDGKRLLYGAEHPQAFAQSELFTATLDGAHARDVSARLDRNVQFGIFTPHDRIVAGANDATRARLFELQPDGTSRTLPLGDIDVNGGANASRDGTLAFTGITPTHPPELYVLEPAAAATQPRRLTHYNDTVAAHALGRTRTLTWRSADGFTVDGVLTEPPAAVAQGKKYPLMVLIHGGPTATSLEGFSALAQLMAARGWLVFQPNYRGSDNLGRRFAMATVPHITSAPGRDVLDGVDAVQKLGIVDAARIGVSGWSEGGLLTSWLITQDHRWRAAMSGAAVNDWTGYADMTDAQDFAPSFIGPSPWASEKMRALYAAESPLTYASNVKTPTLILTDAGDQRVPTPLSYEFYHAVRATGTPVEMIVFPVNGHNPSDPLHREERTHLWIDWFAKHF